MLVFSYSQLGRKVGLEEYLGIVSDVSILIFPARKDGRIDQDQEYG